MIGYKTFGRLTAARILEVQEIASMQTKKGDEGLEVRAQVLELDTARFTLRYSPFYSLMVWGMLAKISMSKFFLMMGVILMLFKGI